MTGTSRHLWTLVLVAIVYCGVPSVARGQEDITIRIIEEPYREVYAFGQLSFDGLLSREVVRDGETIQADQIGGGLMFMSARRSNFQSRLGLSGRQLLLPDRTRITFLSMQLGGQFYPLRPTLTLGNLAMRLTFGGLGGGTYVDGGEALFIANVEANAGLAFSFGNDPVALYAMAIYRPLEESVSKTFYARPGWSITLGIQFPPAG